MQKLQFVVYWCAELILGVAQEVPHLVVTVRLPGKQQRQEFPMGSQYIVLHLQ